MMRFRGPSGRRGLPPDARNLELRAAVGCVGDRNRPSVGPGDSPDDAQPKPGPFGRSGVPRLEHRLALVRGNAGAVVGDVEPVLQVTESDGDAVAVVDSVLDAVPKQVLKELLEAAPVGPNRPLRLDE